MDSSLLPILQRAFPDRLDTRISSLQRITEGWESEIYAFRMEYRLPGRDAPDSQDLILRIYPGDNQPAAARKAEGEYRTLGLLGQVNYPVPRVFYLDTDLSGSNPLGRPFMIMEKFDGQPMWTLLSDASRRKVLFETFCRLFVRLHSLDLRGLAPEWEQAIPRSPTDMIDRLFGSFRPFMERLPLPGFKPVMEWLEARKAQAGSLRLSVTHWDFHPMNVLVSSNGAACVIDWTGAELTDYRFDLAWTLLLFLCYEGPEMRADILAEYERQAGAKVESLEFFDVAACLRRLFSIVASVAYGAEKLGMRPGAEQTMLSQVEPIRRAYGLLQERTGIRVREVEEILENQ